MVMVVVKMTGEKRSGTAIVTRMSVRGEETGKTASVEGRTSQRLGKVRTDHEKGMTMKPRATIEIEEETRTANESIVANANDLIQPAAKEDHHGTEIVSQEGEMMIIERNDCYYLQTGLLYRWKSRR